MRATGKRDVRHSRWSSPARSLLAALLMLMALSPEAWATPNFARKYQKNCGMCHTMVPQLNRTGYEFRLAGYRLPDEIGKEEKDSDFNLGDMTAARLEASYTYAKHTDVAGASASTANSELAFEGASLFPLSGSWGKNFGSFVELTMSPNDVFEIEMAFVRAVYGDDKGWFQTRLGIMHPWEGFGASDEPISISLPLFQTQTATGSPFVLMDTNEMAWEVGYYFLPVGTNVSARIGNGIIWSDDGSGMAEPAQGGNLSKEASLPAHGAKSYSAVIQQFITKDSGVTLHYYRTRVPSPNPFASPPLSCSTTTPAGCTTDTIERLDAYANFYVVPKLVNVLAGYVRGNDKIEDASVDPSLAAVGKSNGYFGEVDYFPIEHRLGAGVRYDAFDPSDKATRDRLNEFAVFGNYAVYKGLQILGEYKLVDTQQPVGTNRDHQFEVLFRLVQ